ncbi:PPC domain-containing protein [Brasilonema sp. UFV-L1]|uniref:PPC domain-containing protein n=1 Tax=Brasilonema sp. UFV-L1 TaxID=2234130 RepID=UPI00145E120B|nr:PPC domain-containing protein [Brasilonema sp. UFV-L1]NMG07917.1 peptidase [Brasilonema sp. UFV-L1]
MINKGLAVGLKQVTIIPATLLAIAISTTAAFAQANKFYNPMPIPVGNELTDTLSDKDIPTGQGGFARDYMVKLNKGDNLVIDLVSESFDCMITLLAPNGTTLAENDDGPDGTSNSLLFTRVAETGHYVIRVRSFGETGIGTFKLKVTRLQPAK